MWPAEEWEESNGEQEEVKDSFYTSMGYSLVTPGPEVCDLVLFYKNSNAPFFQNNVSRIWEMFSINKLVTMTMGHTPRTLSLP